MLHNLLALEFYKVPFFVCIYFEAVRNFSCSLSPLRKSKLLGKSLQFRSTFKLARLLSLFPLCIPIQVHAANVTLNWWPNGEPNLDHYVVYWGTSSGSYTSSTIVSRDITNYEIIGLSSGTKYYFVITAVDDQGDESAFSREVYWKKYDNPIDGVRDVEWGITSGLLKGCKIVFSSKDPVPTLGDSREIPPLNVSGASAIGLPLNLETEPQGFLFTTPVTIYIPCPGFSNVSELDIYYYEDGSGWLPSSDGDDPDSVEPDAANWMVEGSRVNHNNGDPSTIEIQAYHFSGAQAAATSSDGLTSTSSGGGGGCFIGTAASDKLLRIFP